MKKFLKRNLYLISFILIPIFFLWHPNWLALFGNQPYWPLFWLLPYSMINGSFYGLLVGLFVGITLDALTPTGSLTQIPGLILCGVWFGRFKPCNNFWVNHFRYGLLCSIGSFLCGIIYILQILIKSFSNNVVLLFGTAIENVFVEVFLTGLFAPFFCSQLLRLYKNSKEKFN